VEILIYFSLFSFLVAKADSQQWSAVVPGVEFRKFTSSNDNVQPSPNEVFVVRISRSQSDILLDVGVGYGKIRDQREKVSGIAARYEDVTNYNGQRYDVVAAINGDFFTVDGRVSGGQVILGSYADKLSFRGKFAFKTLSSVFIDKQVSYSGRVIFADGSEANIDDINVSRGTNELILYTFHYDTATFTNDNGCEVVVGYVNEAISPNKEVEGVVREIRSGAGSAPIPFDGFVLSGDGLAGALLEQKCSVGDIIKIKLGITSSADKDWGGVYSAVEGAQWFVSNGVLTSELWEERHPRTAIAYNDDYIYLIVCDGRRASSIGMKLSELGNFCIQHLQAKDALNLDGGGSSTMWVNGSVVNQPSGGDERAVANALLVVKTTSAKSTQFGSFEVARVSTEGAHIRLGPGTNFGVLCSLPRGVSVTVLPNPLNGVFAKGHYWWKVRYGSYEGWVAEAFLEKVPNVSVQYPRLSWDSINGSSHSIVITFNSSSSLNTPVVWWGTVENYPLFLSTGATFWSSACSRYINVVKLDELQSGKTFYYVAGSPDHGWSVQSFFKVGPPIGSVSDVKLLFTADTWNQRDIAQQMYDRIVGHDFDILLFGGGIVTAGTEQSQWEAWFDIYKALLSRKPFFSSDADNEDSAANLFDQFSWPNNEKWYSFNYGNVHIIYLQVKSEFSSIDEVSEQYSWLLSDLQQATSNHDIKWKLVILHAPPYAEGGPRSRNSLIVPTVCKLFQQYGVDIVLSGHIHSYTRSHKIYQTLFGTEVISEEGPSFSSSIEGVVYVSVGSAGAPLYGTKLTTWTAVAASEYNYALIDIDNTSNKLTFTAYNINDVVIDSFTITKVTTLLPAAPANVKVSHKGYGFVLSWSPMSGATAYDVRVRPSGGDWSYVYDITLPNADGIGWPAYYYVVPSSGSYDFGVRSKNAIGVSSWVDIFNIVFPGYTPPVIIHTPIDVIGVKGNIIKLSALVFDAAGIKEVKLQYRVKLGNAWREYVEKVMVPSSSKKNLFYVVLSEGITNNDDIEAIEYEITCENNLGLFGRSGVFYVEFKTVVEGVVGELGGSVVLPDGNPEDGECGLDVGGGVVDRDTKIRLSQLSRDKAVLHQERWLVYDQLQPVMVYKLESEPAISGSKSGIVLKLLYLDVDGDGREDVSGIDEGKLRVWWLDEEAREWRYVGGDVDTKRNVISVKISRLGVYGIYPTVGVSGEMFKPKEKIVILSENTSSVHKVQRAVIFSGIHNVGAIVKIYDIRGRKVRELVDTDVWDCRDDNGSVVDSGVYIYQYEFEGEKYQGTIVIGR